MLSASAVLQTWHLAPPYFGGGRLWHVFGIFDCAPFRPITGWRTDARRLPRGSARWTNAVVCRVGLSDPPSVLCYLIYGPHAPRRMRTWWRRICEVYHPHRTGPEVES